MLAVERAGFIMNELSNKKIVLVAELSKELKVSEETVRKDLEKLEKQGKLQKVHGGAYLNEGYSNETPVSVRAEIFQEVKENLAFSCMQFIEEKETIFLDCSTTIYHLAKQLVNYEKKLTVVTNSLMSAEKLSANPNIRLILLGGELNREAAAFDGYTVFEALERYHIDKAFLSPSGLDGKFGMTDYTQEQADLRRKVLQEAGQCICVSDETKIGKRGTYIVGGVEKISHLVLENPLQEEEEDLKRKINEFQIHVITCRKKGRNE